MANLKITEYNPFEDILVKISIHQAFDFVSQISRKGIHNDTDMDKVAVKAYEISSDLSKEYGDDIAYAFDRMIYKLMYPEKF